MKKVYITPETEVVDCLVGSIMIGAGEMSDPSFKRCLKRDVLHDDFEEGVVDFPQNNLWDGKAEIDHL